MFSGYILILKINGVAIATTD